MATCPEGHDVPAYATFCTTCGASVATEEGSTPLLSSPVAPTAALPQAPARPPVQTPPVASAPPPGTWGAQARPPAAAPVTARPPQGAPAWPGRPQAQPANQPTAYGLGVALPYRFQLRRLTLTDQITAAAAVLLFIALWLPWFGVDSSGYDLGGINAHSYLAFALLTCVMLMAYLAARAGWDRLPFRLPIAHAPLLLVLGLAQLLIVVIAFLSVPRYLSHSFGSWLALIAALGACLPIVIPAIQASARR